EVLKARAIIVLMQFGEVLRPILGMINRLQECHSRIPYLLAARNGLPVIGTIGQTANRGCSPGNRASVSWITAVVDDAGSRRETTANSLSPPSATAVVQIIQASKRNRNILMLMLLPLLHHGADAGPEL